VRATPDPSVCVDPEIRALVGGVVLKSWACPPKRWPLAVVVVAPPAVVRVVPRSELAAELRANDLPALAHECVSRRVPPLSVLIYCAVDDGVGFRVVSLAPRRSS
jgi:hypothetical protein